jgi:hypothetical protein
VFLRSPAGDERLHMLWLAIITTGSAAAALVCVAYAVATGERRER